MVEHLVADTPDTLPDANEEPVESKDGNNDGKVSSCDGPWIVQRVQVAKNYVPKSKNSCIVDAHEKQKYNDVVKCRLHYPEHGADQGRDKDDSSCQVVVHGHGEVGHGEVGHGEGAHEDGEPLHGAAGHDMVDQVGYEGTDGYKGDIRGPGPGGHVACHGGPGGGPGGPGTKLPGPAGGVEGAGASPVLQGGDHAGA